jgi:hypothetical protein
MWPFLITILLSAVPFFFAWASIHEVSHFLALKSMRKITNVEFKIYPHKIPGIGFVWASVSSDFLGADLTKKESILFSLAPRFMDILAVFMLPLSFLFPLLSWMQALWMVFWFCGIVDLFIGSLGSSPASDLRCAADDAKISPWFLRVPGMVLVAVSILVTILLIVL